MIETTSGQRHHATYVYPAHNCGRPYLVDVLIERRFEGKDSDWYEFFSVARNIPRQS